MRIVMLSDVEARGGAAIAASRLAEALESAGHEVWRLVHGAEGQRDRLRILRPRPGMEQRLSAIPGIRRLLRGPLARRLVRDALDELRPDVVSVHNLHDARSDGWSIAHVHECAARAPTVWTLHDMWSFTGRCAYTGACARFVNGCGAECPTPREAPALHPLRIAGAWRARRDLLQGDAPLTAVTPSSWLAARAGAGLWRGRRVEVIPNGLPLDRYLPRERVAARAALGLEPTGRVVLVGASDLGDRRKGLDLVAAALPRLRSLPLTLLVMGRGGVKVEAPGVRVVHAGFTSGPALQSLVYAAADLYLHAAREDNLPNTVIEALACGTPVVALPIGGVPEAVRPGVTGWLADGPSAEALARALDEALEDVERDDRRARCRAVAEAEYGDSLQAQRYVRLFEEVR